MQNFFRKPKIKLLLLLCVLAVIALLTDYNISNCWPLLTVSIAASIFTQMLFFGTNSSSSFQSAAVTGMIIGLLIAPGSNLLICLIASFTAIASKKIIVYRKNKHIFNPAAFGLIISLFIFGNHINWWGNSSFIIVIIIGGFILFRLNRLSFPFSYFIFRIISASILMGLGSFISLLLLPNLFFAFIMLPEPKTTPGKRIPQWIFGGICGILATTAYYFIPEFEGDLLALLVVNLY